MLYAIIVYEGWADGSWKCVGYEIIFRDISKALSYAYKKTSNAPCSRHYGIKRIQEDVARADGLEDLIES